MLDELSVHYAPTPDFERAEKKMLRAFTDAVAPGARAALHEPERVKRHGITGATGDLPGGAD